MVVNQGENRTFESNTTQLSKLLDDLAEFLSNKAKGQRFNDEIKTVLDEGVNYIKKNSHEFKKISSAIDELGISKFIRANKVGGNIDIPFVLRISNGRKDLVESLLLSLKEVREGKTITQLMKEFRIADPPLRASLSNYQARIWYTWKKTQIQKSIKNIKSLEHRAKKAFELRNEYRNAARQYMSDRNWAEYLEKVEKNQEWDKFLNYVLDKEEIRNMDDAYLYIIQKSQTGRDGVDKLFKLK